MATDGYFAACIKIELRLYIRSRLGCVTSSGLHQRQTASLNMRHKFDCATPAAIYKLMDKHTYRYMNIYIYICIIIYHKSQNFKLSSTANNPQIVQ